MKKFIVLYHSTPEAMTQWMNATPAEQQAGMKPWMDWKAKNESHVLDFGSPVMGGVKVNSNGTSTASSSRVGGYSILQGANLKQIEGILIDHPHNKEEYGMTVEVHESMEM